MGKLRIAVIEDDPDIRRLLEEWLIRDSHEILTLSNAIEIQKYLGEFRPDVVILDNRLPGKSGMEALVEIKCTDPLVEVILITAYYTIEEAVKSIKLGAYNYIPKPVPMEKLLGDINEIRKIRSLRSMTGDLERRIVERYEFSGMVGRNPAMLELFSLAKRVAPHFSTALITGETGTGKELLARALHMMSPRAGGPFVVFNCAALPESLAESELFGFEKGSFTGAFQAKPGLFEIAQGGTIFLDEIAEMPVSLQAKLLRAIDEREIKRIGSTKLINLDINIILATNRDLRKAIQAGSFREDLYHRINIIEFFIPPLRERKDDIPLLYMHFLENFNKKFNRNIKGASLPVKKFFMEYHWPGNVRELKNVIERAVMVADEDFILMRHLPSYMLQEKREESEMEEGRIISLDEAEKIHIEKILRITEGNRQRAASLLGISRTSLYRKMRKHGLI